MFDISSLRKQDMEESLPILFDFVCVRDARSDEPSLLNREFYLVGNGESMAFYTTEYAQFQSGAQTATVRWFAEPAHVLQPTRPPILHWLNCSGYLIQANGTPLLRLPKPAERSKFDSGMHP